MVESLATPCDKGDSYASLATPVDRGSPQAPEGIGDNHNRRVFQRSSFSSQSESFVLNQRAASGKDF